MDAGSTLPGMYIVTFVCQAPSYCLCRCNAPRALIPSMRTFCKKTMNTYSTYISYLILQDVHGNICLPRSNGYFSFTFLSSANNQWILVVQYVHDNVCQAPSYWLCRYNVPRALTTLHWRILGNFLALVYVVTCVCYFLLFLKSG